VRVTLVCEDESSTSLRLSALASRSSESSDPEERQRADYQLNLGAPIAVEPGYHHLEVDWPGHHESSLVISAPRHCPMPGRGWGVFAPLHALRSAEDWGVGSYSDLGDFGSWAHALGSSFISTLPFNATYLEGAFADPSPYRPVSRLAWNEVFIDVSRLAEEERAFDSAWPEIGLDALAASRALRGRAIADPIAVMALKRRVLQSFADALHRGGSRRREEMETFLRLSPEIEAYARFRAANELDEVSARTWRDQRGLRGDPAEELERRVRYHRYVQWVANLEVASAASRAALYLDLPVGVHPEGFDTHHFATSFAHGVGGGASPDIFQPAGQNWRVSPLHPDGVRLAHYGYPIAFLRFAMRHASFVRIDHVMGLERLWWVPDGMDAADGAYVRYHADEMRAIVVLEASRAGVAVVGEDLGTVSPAIRRAMRQDDMMRCHVHQFAATKDEPLPDPPEDSIASLGSHDLATFASWWRGADIDERESSGRESRADADADRAERALIRAGTLNSEVRDAPSFVERGLERVLVHLARGPGRLVLVDIEDTWLEAEPQNRPGTGQERANFRRRWSRTFPDAFSSDNNATTLLLQAIDRSRRAETPRDGESASGTVLGVDPAPLMGS
jgi:4-alpha-glucanotransferase